jgi:coronin-1B/1C/6
MDWHPFMETLLATASEDCSVKVSVIPDEGLTENVNEAAVSLNGHQKKAALVHFHPGANNVLASSGYDHDIKIWDIEAQAEMMAFTEHDELIQSYEWNSVGSLIASTCQDKYDLSFSTCFLQDLVLIGVSDFLRKIRTFDPRQSGSVTCVPGFDGGKSSRCVWMDNRNKLCVVGFSRTSMRKIGLWDPRKMSSMLHELDLDQSAGVLMPFYDPDTSVFSFRLGSYSFC